MDLITVHAVNPKGHPKTLVAKHPGNRNAVKAGVFSDALLAPRILDLEAAISERPAHEVAMEVLRHEVASLTVLGEAMDQSLDASGLNGRRGEPRRMIDLRLRLNDKLRRTVDQYVRIQEETAAVTEEAPWKSIAEVDAQIELLAAELHRRNSSS